MCKYAEHLYLNVDSGDFSNIKASVSYLRGEVYLTFETPECDRLNGEHLLGLMDISEGVLSLPSQDIVKLVMGDATHKDCILDKLHFLTDCGCEVCMDCDKHGNTLLDLMLTESPEDKADREYQQEVYLASHGIMSEDELE